MIIRRRACFRLSAVSYTLSSEIKRRLYYRALIEKTGISSGGYRQAITNFVNWFLSKRLRLHLQSYRCHGDCNYTC